MKKLIFISIILFACSCKKQSIEPVKINTTSISKDSIEAQKLNISVTQYLQVKSILNSFIHDNQHDHPGILNGDQLTDFGISH